MAWNPTWLVHFVIRKMRPQIISPFNPQCTPVDKIWSRAVYAKDPIHILNIKLKRIKTHFKGWGSNKFGNDKRRKEDLRLELSLLEELEKDGPLTPEMYSRKIEINFELHELLVIEEIFWLQQSQER